jgi:hypothetical protein
MLLPVACRNKEDFFFYTFSITLNFFMKAIVKTGSISIIMYRRRKITTQSGPVVND